MILLWKYSPASIELVQNLLAKCCKCLFHTDIPEKINRNVSKFQSKFNRVAFSKPASFLASWPFTKKIWDLMGCISTCRYLSSQTSDLRGKHKFAPGVAKLGSGCSWLGCFFKEHASLPFWWKIAWSPVGSLNCSYVFRQLGSFMWLFICIFFVWPPPSNSDLFP